jgi:hypothetical protein
MSATIHQLPPSRPHRDPDLEEARTKLLRCTLRVYSHPEGSPLRGAAEGARNWWLAEVKRLNPGGAEIINLRPLLTVRRKSLAR